MAKKQREQIEESSGNVFADIGVPRAGEALAKAKLAVAIADRIRGLRLTQKTAAQRMGIDQPKVSALMNGRLAGFSIERLFGFVVALGYEVTITVGAKRSAKPEVRVLDGELAPRKSTRRSAGAA